MKWGFLMSYLSFIKISDLHFSSTLKTILFKELGLVTLEDLLNTDYSTLIHTKGIGKKRIEELNQSVTSMGYKLKNLQEVIEEFKSGKNGLEVKYLEELGFSLSIASPLYKNNIYTLEDLISCGKDVYRLRGIGVKKGKAIWQKMQELNIPFPKCFDDLDQSLNQVNDENLHFKKSLEYKRCLLQKYKLANQLKSQLLEEQRSLDKQLEKERNSLYSLLIDGRGDVSYLYDNTDEPGLNASSMMGFLIHSNSIKEFVNQLPISKYYILGENQEIVEITKRQADFLYDQILEYNLRKNGN